MYKTLFDTERGNKVIKVEEVIAKYNMEIKEDGNVGTFTENETYYARDSKKGNIVVKSNEGQWIALRSTKISYRNVLSQKFYRVGNIFFKNRKELRRISV